MVGFGILAGLMSCASWAWSASNFQPFVRSRGPMVCNLFKTVVATLFFGLSVLVMAMLGRMEVGGAEDWAWIALSGFVGMALGDWALLAAVGVSGVRQAMLIHGTSPLFLLLWSLLGGGETLGVELVIGIVLVTLGVALVTALGKKEDGSRHWHLDRGLLFGLLAALGQAVGILIAKDALPAFDTISASGIRLLGALVGLVLIQLLRRRLVATVAAVRCGELWKRLAFPAFVGTYVGIILMMICIDRSPAAVAGALLSTTPLFVIPFAMRMHGDRVGPGVILGTAVAVFGIAVVSAPALLKPISGILS